MKWTVKGSGVLVVLLSVSVGAAQAQQCNLEQPCRPGLACMDGQCQPIERVLATSDPVYWVAQRHPAADDANPGTRDRPWRTIGRATARGALGPGSTVIIREGVYREAIRPAVSGMPGAPIAFIGYPGEEVVVSGADEVAGGTWQPTGNGWTRPWTWGARKTNVSNQNNPDAWRRELFVADGEVLRPVYRQEDLAPGTFYVEGPDEAPRQVTVRLREDRDPNAAEMEVGQRAILFQPPGGGTDCGKPGRGAFYYVNGLTFRHAVNHGQHGAVCPGSEGSTLEDVTVEWTNGTGFKIKGRGHVARGVRALDNGESGIGGSCEGCLIEDAESARNNWKGYPTMWESGGGKFTHTTNTVFRNLYYHDNDGPGLWLDYQNFHNVIENSRFVGNQGVGIFLEYTSDHNRVVNNVVTQTRYQNSLYGGDGIAVTGSSHNLIAYNTIMMNEADGVDVRDDNRDPTAVGNMVFNNLFVQNVTHWGERNGREMAFRSNIGGMSERLEKVRTNVADGNRYWQRPLDAADANNATFYYAPNPQGRVNVSTNDLSEWQAVSGGDVRAGVLDLEAPLLAGAAKAGSGWRLSAQSQACGGAVALPRDARPILRDIDGQERPLAGGDVGADQHCPLKGSLRVPLETGWNLVSGPLRLDRDRMEAVLAGLAPKLTLAKDKDGQVYAPAYGVDQIGAWAADQSYLLYMREADTLTLSGTWLSAEDAPLVLKKGWNYLPYLRSYPLEVDEALAGIEANLVVAEDLAGRRYAPGEGLRTLSRLEPGRGYMVYMRRPATLVYPHHPEGTEALAQR